MTPAAYLGIDVAKGACDLGSTGKHLGRFTNNASGIRKLVARLQQLQPTLVALEATGIYHADLAAACHQANVPIAIVEPGRVRHFALAKGIKAKSDDIDAVVIAQFAEGTKPAPTPAPRPEDTRLRALQDRIDQVVDDRIREQNRLEACRDADIRRLLEQSIDRLQKEEDDLLTRAKTLIASHKHLARKSRAMQEVPGVALKTVIKLLALLPELGTVSRQRIAALVGLAPYRDASGNREGIRRIAGGRARVRKALYMPAVTAIRYNPVLAKIYARLTKAGKPNKVALTACMRKLLVHLNAIIANLEAPPQVAQPLNPSMVG